MAEVKGVACFHHERRVNLLLLGSAAVDYSVLVFSLFSQLFANGVSDQTRWIYTLFVFHAHDILR